MKKTILLLVAFISFISLTNAQEGINYQAVVRDNNGDLMKNTAVEIEFNIIRTSTSGTIDYTETHSLMSNNFGNVVAVIGQGTPTFGTFDNVAWGKSKFFLNVVVNTVDMGTTEFLSVPKALYADHAFSADTLLNPLWFKSDSYPGSAYTTLTPRVSKSNIATGLSLLELTRFSLGMFPISGTIDTVFLVEKYGEVQRPEISGDADVLPLAYANIGGTNILNGTKNVLSVINSGTGVYEVEVDGESASASNYTVLATSYDAGGGEIVTWSVSAGKFVFHVVNDSGAATNSNFSFIIYKP